MVTSRYGMNNIPSCLILISLQLCVYVMSAFLTMSVPKSMQRMVMVPRGRGMLTMMKNRKGVISGMLLVRV